MAIRRGPCPSEEVEARSPVAGGISDSLADPFIVNHVIRSIRTRFINIFINIVLPITLLYLTMIVFLRETAKKMNV
jgi:hypothetical protein